jgi:hypothetical protein
LHVASRARALALVTAAGGLAMTGTIAPTDPLAIPIRACRWP